MFPAKVFLIFSLTNVVENVFGQSKILSYHHCETDADCFENSFCYKENVDVNKCRCKENFLLTPFNRTTYECLPVVGFDDPCTIEIQCQVKLGSLATCDEKDSICKCINGAHLGTDQFCHETVPLGEVCKTTNNCLLSDGTYGVCFIGKCRCNTHEHAPEGQNICVASAHLNQECAFQENCVSAFSSCYGGICKCMPGYVESKYNTRCLLAASAVGDSCNQTIQCSEYIKGSFCDNNTCVCKSAYHGYGNECVPDAKLGDRCTVDKECVITAELEHSVRCTNQVCICVEGVTDQNSYGCIIKSGSQHILPSTVCNIFIHFMIFIYLKKL